MYITDYGQQNVSFALFDHLKKDLFDKCDLSDTCFTSTCRVIRNPNSSLQLFCYTTSEGEIVINLISCIKIKFNYFNAKKD